MPDATSHPSHSPAHWHAAFAALPLEEAPADGWAAVAQRLDARRPRLSRWPLPLAAAAALALAIVPAWLPRTADEAPSDNPTRLATATRTPDAGPAPAGATLEQMFAESARLESLLQYARDNRVASGAAAVMATELDARLGTIDAQLMQPGLGQARKRELWGERVQLLRTFAGFESTRRWLAANGERYDGALVRVD